MTRPTVRSNQAGVASIIVTMIMMVVITLIVIGFSQVARRNSRESLDRQLSTQAYYAAETGVNDAINAIKSNGSIIEKTSCQGGAGYTGLSGVLDATANVSYTCLLVNPSPTSLVYSTIEQQKSTVVSLEIDGGINLGVLTFKWNSDGAGGPPPQCGSGSQWPTAANWKCNHAMLRADLTKVNGGVTNAQGLNNTTTSLYMRPGPSSSGTIIDGTTKSYISTASCNNSSCTAKIALAPAAQSNRYFLRLTAMYENAKDVQVSGTNAAGSTAAFNNAQVVIDSTGKAQDQLRRISVRVPVGISNSQTLPSNGLQTSAAICKRFTTGPAPLTTNSALCL
ncbi:MAG: hypothetical protein JWM37_123 [Candidatus Saccharibacteria bacterium]|nr:hypothetical protein [Candidatus Saccharibacteria bacterium]